jgi:hypothetical protein
MDENTDLNEQVCVTFTVGQWAKVITAVATAPFDLAVKESLNSNIYDCVRRKERLLS